MCGIVGFIDPSPSLERLRRANACLLHRGPDDGRTVISGPAALAARRLSIIDLEDGGQPLSNADETCWIAYNGEVFNAPELREELLALGYRFRTRSDTEVVLLAYEAWGPAFVERLRGMFAFAIWDAPRQRLLLARDWFGIKPLYYSPTATGLAFASEIRALFKACPDLTPEADRRALVQLFARGYVPSPHSPFVGIHQLPAAHMLIHEGGQTEIKPYWTLAFPEAGQHRRQDPVEAQQEFLVRLREAVAAWRMSDVPVGSLLSGGIDSAALATLLSEVSGESIHTFNIRFTEASHDESAAARLTAEHIGSQHEEIVFSLADFDRLPDVIRHLESPQCSATSIPISMLYQACHEAGFKVILTGEGADELLGGYHWFAGDRRARPLLGLPDGVRRALSRSPLPMSGPARRVLASGERDAQRRYDLWTQVATPSVLPNLLTFNLPTFPLTVPNLTGRDPLDQFLQLDSQGRMVDFINFEVDRMSMMHSVEARPPFLDQRLWDWTVQADPKLKLGRSGNKLLLRNALRGRLPDTVLRRPKKGLATPHALWWRHDLPGWAQEFVSPAALQESGYFQHPEVERLRQAHQHGRADHSGLLTGVLTTQIWHMQVLAGMG
jgi:asparagine synthase (glutamine-hydrolysing)